MKKFRQAKQFLEELSKTPVVSAVCNKLNLSRQTVYRWIKEDPEFARVYEECLKQGTDNINDLAESKLIAAINRSESWAIKYWLDNNKNNYIKPRSKDFWDLLMPKRLSKDIIKIMMAREIAEKNGLDKEEDRSS